MKRRVVTIVSWSGGLLSERVMFEQTFEELEEASQGDGIRKLWENEVVQRSRSRIMTGVFRAARMLSRIRKR